MSLQELGVNDFHFPIKFNNFVTDILSSFIIRIVFHIKHCLSVAI
jgi:hypothetical protein